MTTLHFRRPTVRLHHRFLCAVAGHKPGGKGKTRRRCLRCLAWLTTFRDGEWHR